VCATTGAAHRPAPEAALNLDRLRRTRGDPGVGTSSQAPVRTPNPRVKVLERLPSPSPDPPAYWLMEPSNSVTSLRGHQEPPCAIPCPYPVAPRWTMPSSPSLREEGEWVAIVEEDDEEEPMEVIPILDSPPRTAPR
jgi:hypothetical protein